jgi:spermidine/putrescine-binding protein
MSFPKVDGYNGMIQYGWIGVVNGSENAEAAEYFINRYLAMEVQETLARKNGVGPVNKMAAEALKKEPILNELMLLKEGEIANAYFADWSKFSLSEWTDKWNRTMAK